MEGLLVEQRIEKGRIEFERERILQADRKRFQAAEHGREMQRLRLQRPATPEEGARLRQRLILRMQERLPTMDTVMIEASIARMIDATSGFLWCPSHIALLIWAT